MVQPRVITALMTSKFRYAVPSHLLIDAQTVWMRRYSHSVTWTRNVEKQFFEFLGIPEKKYFEYDETWKIVVDQATYKKLEILASDNPHQETLFKIIEARYGKSST
jgi:hypothetical protein